VSGEIVRSLHFPEPIDPDSAKADFHDGLLHLTANLAKGSKPRSVEVRSM
jgi:HSP20 family molecular chaperone IbpA